LNENNMYELKINEAKKFKYNFRQITDNHFFIYICITNPDLNLNGFETVLDWFWIRGYSDISVI